MIKIIPVGAPSAISQPPMRTPDEAYPRGHGQHASQSDTFQASLLGLHAQQLDPDAQSGAKPDVAQREAELEHLLQMLTERLASMQERALLSAGHASHGLMQELWQINEVLLRLVALWQCSLSFSLRRVASQRLAMIFGTCHFLLRAVVHAGVPHEWQALQQALQLREEELR